MTHFLVAFIPPTLPPLPKGQNFSSWNSFIFGGHLWMLSEGGNLQSFAGWYGRELFSLPAPHLKQKRDISWGGKPNFALAAIANSARLFADDTCRNASAAFMAIP